MRFWNCCSNGLREALAVFTAAPICALMLIGAGQAHGATYYVSPAGSGSGSSPVSPRKAQVALDAARDGDRLVFLDGSYGALSLSSRDNGPGIITLEAENPVLAGIDYDAEQVVGLRSAGGAVVIGGLVVSGHNGVVVRGLKFTQSDRGVYLKSGASNVIIEGNWFRENGTFGVLVYTSVASVVVRDNLFENYKSEGAGWFMDYGVASYADTTVTIAGNMYRGSFNQANSSKEASDLVFTGNLVLIDRGSGILCGQEPDTAEERTAGSCTIEGNKFVNNGYYGIRLLNVEKAYIKGNLFQGSAGILYTLHRANLAGSRIQLPWPRYVLFANNRIVGGGRVRLEGRGVAGDTVRFEANVGLAACARYQLADTSFANEQTTAPPIVEHVGNSFACS